MNDNGYRADELGQRASAVVYDVKEPPKVEPKPKQEPPKPTVVIERQEPQVIPTPQVVVNVPENSINVQIEQPKTKTIRVTRDIGGTITSLTIE